PAPQATVETAPRQFTQEELNQLLGPVALYPDALIALILPASTVPSDLVLAARFLAANGDPAQVDGQPWDDSVKSLVRYGDIVKWMDQNLAWTTQLGEAFLDQPADVMNTIQQLRSQAKTAGTLVDTPQQQVIEDESYIRIVPAEPDLVYVPQYDPAVVYVESYEPYLGPALFFGAGFAVGPWLNYDCDWGRRKVCVGDWNPRWKNDWHPRWKDDWKHPRGGNDVRTVDVVNINRDTARVWQPSPKSQRQHWKQRYQENVANKNYRGRDGNANERGRRFPVVAKPSRLDFEGRKGGEDRQRWRDSSEQNRSHYARNRSGEIERPVSRGPNYRDEDFEQRREKSNRGWTERKGRETGQDRRESNRLSSQRSEGLSRPQVRQGDDVQQRRSRGNTDAVRSDRFSSSESRDRSRPQQYKRSISKSDNNSQRHVKASSHSSSQSVNNSRADRSKFVSSRGNDSQRHVKSDRARSSQRVVSNSSNSNRVQQSSRIQGSSNQARRSAPSYSRSEGRQYASAASGRGGKHGSGKKGGRDGGNRESR
ncbi:MAG TPA: DUF3300 domain-containing protein, partial [Terrimicrobiaceae bacterium]